MKIATLSGIRGGAGTTSLVAALGFALQALGNRVLLIDLCPTNLLRLHGNLPFDTTAGWARADLDGDNWQDQAFHILDQLFLLPHGTLTATERTEIEERQRLDAHYWAKRLEQLTGRIDWVLFDMPAGGGESPTLRDSSLRLQIIEADAATQARLAQEAHDDCYLLVNRFDAESQLQRDLVLLWREHLHHRLVPQVIHRDESMAAALAHKSPLGCFAADSLAAQDVTSLATWCLTRQEVRQ